MPHVVVQYTANLDPEARIGALCKTLAEIIVAQRDGAGARVFPIGGTRVLAYPTPHFAVADGAADRAFVYLNVRMAAGRTEALKRRIGDALLARAKQHFDPLIAQRHIGITLQIDEAPGQVYDGKLGNLHPLFNN